MLTLGKRVQGSTENWFWEEGTAFLPQNILRDFFLQMSIIFGAQIILMLLNLVENIWLIDLVIHSHNRYLLFCPLIMCNKARPS